MTNQALSEHAPHRGASGGANDPSASDIGGTTSQPTIAVGRRQRIAAQSSRLRAGVGAAALAAAQEHGGAEARGCDCRTGGAGQNAGGGLTKVEGPTTPEKLSTSDPTLTVAPPIRWFIPMRTERGPNAREHHMQRHRRVKAERRVVAWELVTCERHYGKPALPVTVLLRRYAPGNGLDGDNLQGSLKAPRDEVAAWLGADDADKRITWRYAQRRSVRWGVAITFNPTAEDDDEQDA